MNPEFSLNLLMVGVGGQGTVMASDVLSNAALAEGFDVKKSDALGMSQRGGSVVSHVRLGKQVFSPLVKAGEAHILLGFEKLEAARWASHLRPDGLAIVNNQAIPPFSVSSGSEKYPSDETILDLLHRRTESVHLAQGVELAQQAGNPKALNAAMLGFLSIFLDIIKKETWVDSLAGALPTKLLDVNLEAFEIGRRAAGEAQSCLAGHTRFRKGRNVLE
ncbi:MAG: indolepyruvate oxidoreductase subunit beta [Dehalococcoidia bacterium]|nr:indolepyruvate oxidoreductase subunit beta [Dehalococcoidia bacterium]